MAEIVVAGGGFAGLWTTLAAVRELELAGGVARVSIVSPDPYLVLRPRLYEADPAEMRIDLRPTLEPVDVRLITGSAMGVDVPGKHRLLTEGSVPFDRLVLATGSSLARPPIPGAEHLFDVDSYAGAIRLEAHLRSLQERRDSAARTVVIVGGGFTGIELATELRPRLARLWGEAAAAEARLLLLEATAVVGPALGGGPRAAIEAALAAAGVEVRLSSRVEGVA